MSDKQQVNLDSATKIVNLLDEINLLANQNKHEIDKALKKLENQSDTISIKSEEVFKKSKNDLDMVFSSMQSIVSEAKESITTAVNNISTENNKMIMSAVEDLRKHNQTLIKEQQEQGKQSTESLIDELQDTLKKLVSKSEYQKDIDELKSQMSQLMKQKKSKKISDQEI